MRQQEYAFAAAFELQPRGWKTRISGPESLFSLPHFNDQQAVRCKATRRACKEPIHDIQTAFSTIERHSWLVAVLRGELFKPIAGHIGRIGHDDAIRAGRSGEQIGPNQPDSLLHSVLTYVAPSDGQRVRRDVRRIDAHAIAVMRDGNRQASAARAHIQDAVAGLKAAPGRESVFDEFGQRRPGYQHAFIDPEAQAREPGFPQQIRQRFALRHPAPGQFDDTVDQPDVRGRGPCLPGPTLLRANQPVRFIPGIVCAMPVGQVAFGEESRNALGPVCSRPSALERPAEFGDIHGLPMIRVVR